MLKHGGTSTTPPTPDLLTLLLLTGCVDGGCYIRVGGDCLRRLRWDSEWTLYLDFL